MSINRLRKKHILTACFMLFVSICFAQENHLLLKRVEERVNEIVEGRQIEADVAMNKHGNYVVVWAGDAIDLGEGLEIYAQRFRFEQDQIVRIGARIHVNTIRAGTQRVPSVAINDNNQFIVTWSSGALADIYARRYEWLQGDGLLNVDNNGFVINSELNGVQTYSEVVLNNKGEFAVTFDDDNMLAMRRYLWDENNDVIPVDEEQVMMGLNDDGFNQSMSISLNDSSLIALSWSYSSFDDQNLEQNGIYFFIFSMSPDIVTTDTIRVSDKDIAFNHKIHINNKNQVVSFYLDDRNNQNNSNSVYFRRFLLDAQGSLVSLDESPTQVDRLMEGDSSIHDMFMDDNGNFGVLWSNGVNAGKIFSKIYSWDKTVLEDTYIIHDEQVNVQENASVAANNNGDLVFTWHDVTNNGQDNDVFQQFTHINYAPTLLLPENPSVAPNIVIGSTIATLAANDMNEMDTPAFSIVSINGTAYDEIENAPLGLVSENNQARLVSTEYFGSAGPYEVILRVVDANNIQEEQLSDQKTLTISIVTALEDELAAAVNLYPNPASDVLHIKHALNEGNIGVEIFDAIGRKVYQGHLGKRLESIPLHLDSGLHVVRFASSKGIFSKKIIIR